MKEARCLKGGGDGRNDNPGRGPGVYPATMSLKVLISSSRSVVREVADVNINY